MRDSHAGRGINLRMAEMFRRWYTYDLQTDDLCACSERVLSKMTPILRADVLG